MIRSNGSQWKPGSFPICNVASSPIGSNSTLWSRRCRVTYSSGGTRKTRRPRLCFIAISQAEAALRKTSFAGSVIDARGLAKLRVAFDQPDERCGIEQKSHYRRCPSACLPFKEIHDLLRKRVEERLGNLGKPLAQTHRPGLVRRLQQGQDFRDGTVPPAQDIRSPAFNLAMCADR